MGVYFWSTFQNHISGHLEANNMAPLQFIMSLCLVGGVLSAEKLEGKTETEREERSLLNTFPFNAQVEDASYETVEPQREERSLLNTFPYNAQVEDASSETVEPERRFVPAENLSPRDDSQRNDGIDVSFPAVVANGTGRDGKRCIEKVEIVEEIEYDEEVQCDHSYDRRCHTTYVTNYVPQQEEECEENFRKNCFIDYEKVAFNETVHICRKTPVKNCKNRGWGGPEICRTEYESECWTKHEKHHVKDDVVSCKTVKDVKCKKVTSGYTTIDDCKEWPREVCEVSKKHVTKVTPITGCNKVPKEFCAPADCAVKLEEHCYDKTQTIVQDVPKEECTLEPQRTCAHVTKLVPHLKPKEECTDVPKEVCTRSRVNPKKVKKPVMKKWCYAPTKESGLH